MPSSSQPKLSLAQLRQRITAMPFNRILGLQVVRQHRDGVTVECPMADNLRNSAGVMHGGVLATLADVAVGIAIMNHSGGTRPCTTVELNINYMRPVTGKVQARSRILRFGAHLVVGSVEIRGEEGKLAGSALVTYMLLEGKPSQS